MVRRTIYTRRDGNTLREEPSKIKEYEPERTRHNENKGNSVKISVIRASSVSQVMLNTGIAFRIIAIDRITRQETSRDAKKVRQLPLKRIIIKSDNYSLITPFNHNINVLRY